MEDMDDFGDLYADVEVHVNTGIESFHHLYIEEGKKNDDNPKGGFHSNSQKKDVEVDSASEELISHDQICETNGDDMKVSGEDSKTPGFNVGNENLIVDDGSDSEDDLHIVLNEEDCRVFLSASVGNGGRVEGSDDEDEDEDEDDDLVIVTEANHQSKDRKLIDGLEQSAGGPGAERGNASKGTYASQYSQFKYVRPHAAAFPSNSKTSEPAGVVSFSSPMASRGDWDVNGGNQQMMSCSGLDTSSYNLGIQKGFDFYLPRNRTILDVSIETFEWKPWRHPGVDITDFFNFGLDEESWKCYCKSLEHFRQQTTMLTKIPVFESSRPNQVYEAEFLQKTVATGKVGQTKRGERISSMSENVYRGARNFEMPKGRAIQVEGGIGERQSSMDVRRPRYRDSDVVIQIPMLDTTDDSSVSNEGESEHVAESLNVCKNGGIGMEVYQSMQHCGSAHGVPVGGCHQKVMKPVSKEASEQLETVDGANTGNQSKVENATLEAESASASADQIQCNLSPSYLQSHFEASKAGVTFDMEKAYNHARRPSSSSLTASEHRQSNDSTSDTDKTEPMDRKDNSREQSLIQDNQNYCDRMRPHSMAEVEIPAKSDKPFYRVDRKGRYDGDRLRQGTKKGRQHSYDFDENDSIEDKRYYRETEISIGYRGRRIAEKLERRNAYTELFHSKSDAHLREEMGPYFIRDWDEREYLDECITARDDEIKHREYYFREREYSDGGMSAITHKESDLLISENISFHIDRERYLRLRRKNENDHRFRNGSEDDDFELENRYREELPQEKYGRHILYYDKEEDLIQEKYGRRVPYLSREIERLDRRVRDAQSPRFSLDSSWRSVESDFKCRRHPYHKPFSSQTYREFHIADGSEWHDSNPPRNHAYDSWRSKEKYADHWRMPDLQDKRSNKDREEGCFVFDGKKHHYQSHHRRGIDFDEDSGHAGEMVVYTNDDVCDERKRYRWQWTDEEASYGRQVRHGSYDPEASFLLERSSRHEHSCVDHDSAHGRKHLDDNWLERSRKKITVAKSVDSEASKRINSASDIGNGGKHAASVLRCWEPVHLNGWEGKVKLGKPKPSLTPCITVHV